MSNLVNYLLTVATDQATMNAFHAATSKSKSAPQRQALAKRICAQFGLTPKEWTLLTKQYPSPEKAREAIQKYLRTIYPDIVIIFGICGSTPCYGAAAIVVDS